MIQMHLVLFLFYIIFCVCVPAQPSGTSPTGGTSSTNYLDLSGVYTINNQTVTNNNLVIISTVSNQNGIAMSGHMQH